MPGVVASRITPRLTPALRELLRADAERADTTGGVGHEALAALRASGLLAVAIPAAHGGAGQDAAATNALIEQIAVVNPSMAIIAFQHLAVSARIADWGTATQQASWLPRLADGTWLAASAWSESGAGAAKQNLSTTGERRDDGTWVLNGSKTFTTGVGIADIYLVLVRTARSTAPAATGYGAAGQTFFLVDSDNPGLIPELGLDLVGMRGSATGLINLNRAVVPDTDRLGPQEQAASVIASVRESGASLGAVAVGTAQAALDLAVAHARDNGLLDLPTVRHRLVNLATRLEAARAVVGRAGARTANEPGLTTLHSKLHATESAEEICLDVARMLGSAGYRNGAQIGRLLADVRGVSLMGPTNDLCRELVAASWTI